MKNIIVSWSSGKDSTLTLLKLLDDPNYQVVGLFTTYIKGSNSEERVPFQETSMDFVRLQAKSIQLPLIEIELPQVFPENKIYQSLVIHGLKESNLSIDAVAFGDMFCNGIVDYRKNYIEPAGWQCIFPLLNKESIKTAYEIVERGIKTFISCIDSTQFSSEQFCSDTLGKEYTQTLIRTLSKKIDPCGENGEFHTFVYNAPCFSKPIKIEKLEQNKQTRFYTQNYTAQ